MENIIGEYVTRTELGDAFQRYNATRSLGISLAVGDREMISSSLADTAAGLVEDSETVSPFVSDLRSALADSGTDAADGLYSSFDVLASYLSANTDSLSDTEIGSYADGILDAVADQNEVEEKFSAIAQTLQQIQDSLLGFSRPEDPAAGVTATDDVELEEVDVGVDLRERDAFVGGGAGYNLFSGMDEPMYDPELGVVTFGEVYEKYYQIYKEELKSGVIPEELKDMLDQYFYWLNNL